MAVFNAEPVSEKPGTDDDINFYCLARLNRKRSASRSRTLLPGILNLEDVIAGRKRYFIMPIGISYESFDFLLSVRAQNEQRIFRVIRPGSRIAMFGSVVVALLNPLEGNELEIPFHKTWSLSLDQAADGQ